MIAVPSGRIGAITVPLLSSSGARSVTERTSPGPKTYSWVTPTLSLKDLEGATEGSPAGIGVDGLDVSAVGVCGFNAGASVAKARGALKCIARDDVATNTPKRRNRACIP